MTTRNTFTLRIVAATLLFGVGIGLLQTRAAPPDLSSSVDGMQVLTRGPIHEAFVETVVFNPTPGVIVAKTPPAAIEEVPPDQRPEGVNVAWIPGYWGWDDERNDFLWISGIWRDLPPGRQWIPGYWGGVSPGSQWTSGYWADVKATEVEYLPEPPPSVEAGPNVAAPSENDSWLPGSWVWQQNRYAWRAGYWAAVHPDWLWTAAHYVWAPRGYVFVDGYWDHAVARRGILFAPVFFNANVYARPGFFYSPSVVIDSGVFGDQLFVRSNYNHYYFGDYYAAGYANAGFCPSFSYQSGRYGYDPIYAHQNWEHRSDPGWRRQVQTSFQDRRDHQELRPPRTYAAQNAVGTGAGNSRNGNFLAATSLDQFTKRQGNPLRFQPVAKEERQQFAQHGQDMQKFSRDRQGLEANPTKSQTAKADKGFQPTKVKLPASPFVSKPVTETGGDNVSPRTHEVLKPNLNGEPQPRPNLEPQPKPRVQPQPRPNLEPQPKSGIEPQPRPNFEPQPKPRVEPQPRANLEPQPKPSVEPQSRPNLEPQPKPRAEPRPRPASEQQPRPKAEQPQPRPTPETRPRTEPQPQPKQQAQPQPKPQAQPQPGPTKEPPPSAGRDPNQKPNK